MTYVPWELEVQFAPGFSPLDLPTDGDWVSLGEPDGLSIRRGRQDDLDVFETGTMALVLDNSDEDLDHLLSTSDIYDTDALPFTPVRLVATKGGFDSQVIFTGYTLDGFAPSGLRGGGSVTVNVVDWLGWAESVPAPDGPWSAWVAYVKPKVWIRGYTSRQSVGYNDNPDGIAWNSAAVYSGAGYDMIGDVGFPYAVDSGFSSNITTSSTSPGFRMGGVGFGGLIADTTIAQTGQWMAAGFFKTSVVSSLTWAGSDWQVYLNGSGHVVAEVDVNGFNEVATAVANHADDVTHMWVLTVTSTGGSRSMTIETDLDSDLHIIGAAGNSGGGLLNYRGLSFLFSRVGDFVYWDDPAAVAAVIADGSTYDAGQGPPSWAGPSENIGMWSGDTITERIPRLFRTAGASVIDWEACIEADHPLSAVTATPETLSAQLREVGDAYMGATYMLRDGTLRVRDASMTKNYVDIGESRTYDFGTVDAAISDDSSTDTWTANVSDNFNRSNGLQITTGNPAWDFGHLALDGAIGITSNTAYVSDASAAEPVVYFQDLGRDVTVTCGFASVAEGQGLVVRHSSYGNFVTIAQGSGTVDVVGWVAGVGTPIGDTGADDLGTVLTVTTSEDEITVQIDAGTVHTFTITDPVHMIGSGVGVAYTNIGVLPASSARWDNWSASCTRPLIRATNRSRTAPRADRIINIVDTGDVYLLDATSVHRYNERLKVFPTPMASDTDVVEEYATEILAARKDPTIEVGELTIRPWGNQYVTDWLMRDFELERAVTYREALYRAGTEVLDATYRFTGESWDWQRGVDWTVTLKIVPA